MSKLIALIVLVAAGLHGYFYLQYKTVDACQVSAIRLKNEVLGTMQLPPALNPAGAEGDVVKTIANSIREKSGIAECYRGAVFAPDAKAIGIPLLRG
ncbi:hypothetical protein [Oryzibacter oryziterrae]|uniref:hypothetical protein n=1 Tax=Oryzibacter oryziterrae TaxID=2766474 RepID=UPI001F3D7FD2|nr:hypothetical protein [Oryzibacter oryziterrae]